MNTTDIAIVFIHGYTASHLADWYPAISLELEKLGIEYHIPDLPGDEHPHANEWLQTIHEVIVKIQKPFILVGHSLGTRTALLYLEKYRPQVEHVVLIAAFNNSIENARRRNGDAYPDFFDHAIDISAIRPLAKKFTVVHSKDDSSIAYAQGVKIAQELDADLVSCDDRDHLSEPDNAGFILTILKDRIDARI